MRKFVLCLALSAMLPSAAWAQVTEPVSVRQRQVVSGYSFFELTAGWGDNGDMAFVRSTQAASDIYEVVLPQSFNADPNEPTQGILDRVTPAMYLQGAASAPWPSEFDYDGGQLVWMTTGERRLYACTDRDPVGCEASTVPLYSPSGFASCDWFLKTDGGWTAWVQVPNTSCDAWIQNHCTLTSTPNPTCSSTNMVNCCPPGNVPYPPTYSIGVNGPNQFRDEIPGNRPNLTVGMDYDIDVTPDGSQARIAFLTRPSWENHTGEVRVMDYRTGDTWMIDPDDQPRVNLNLSGDLLAYTKYPSAGAYSQGVYGEIWIYDLNTKTETKIPMPDAGCETFSNPRIGGPDGGLVVFLGRGCELDADPALGTTEGTVLYAYYLHQWPNAKRIADVSWAPYPDATYNLEYDLIDGNPAGEFGIFYTWAANSLTSSLKIRYDAIDL